MARKIIPLQSTFGTVTTKVYIPQGARLHSVRGECSTKTTYDFVVTQEVGLVGGGVSVVGVKFCGARNGRPVDLWTQYPIVTTINVAPTAGGHSAVAIQAGDGVSLQIYYAFGSVELH